MVSENLLSVFTNKGLSYEELSLIFQHNFPMGTLNDNKAIFYNASEQIILEYKKKDLKKLKGIYVIGENNSEIVSKVIEMINDEANARKNEFVVRTVLFSEQQIRSYWNYNNKVQILPIPNHAPNTEDLKSPHPFILEFKMSSSHDKALQIQRKTLMVEEYTNLLNALFNIRIWGQTKAFHYKKWVLVEHEKVECLQEYYSYDGFKAIDENFSEITKDIPQINFKALNSYYLSIKNILDAVDLPVSASEYLKNSENLSLENKNSFNRALKWLQYSFEINYSFNSAAYIALVNCIESIMPDPEITGSCQECGRSVGIGPTRHFVNFIKKYIPDELLSNKTAEFYSLRSAITHGGKILLSDVNQFNLLPVTHKERIKHLELTHYVKLLLHNWLLDESKS